MLDLLLPSPKTSPNFFWDFRGGSVPPGAVFTRGSAGGYFDSSGVFAQAGTDVPRFEYDPVTRAPHGYLAERQSTNGLLRSRTLDFADWTKVASSVVADQAVAPDGALTMDKVVENSAAAIAHGVTQAFTLTADTYVGVSIFVKAAERSRAWVNIQGAAGHFATARFDLSTGTLLGTNIGATSGSVASTMIRNVGGGIYRIGLVAKIGQANPFAAYGMEPNAGGSTDAWGQVSYAGDGASGMYFWGAQVDSPGVGITSFMATAGVNATRSADILSLPLTSLPGWNASKGGVLVATYRLHTNTSSTAAQQPVAITDGGNNSIVMEAQSGGHGGNSAMGMLTRSATAQINMTVAGVSAPFVRKRQAVGWGTTAGQMAADGVLNATVSGTYLLPVAPTNLYPGGFVDILNGTVESIAYYVGARPDAEIVKYSR